MDHFPLLIFIAITSPRLNTGVHILQAEFGGIEIDTILEFLLKKEGGFRHLGCIVVNGAMDDGICGLIIWAKYGFLVMMYRCMRAMAPAPATATVRMGSNKKQDICIEYLTTYLQGEVARGHVGGGGGTDTIKFLLEKEGGFRLLARLIQGEGGGGVGELSLARDRDLTAVRAVAAHQLGVVAVRVAVSLEGASGSAPRPGVVWMPQGGGRGIAPGEEELALADDGDGDGGLGSFVALVGGPVPQAAQAKGRDGRNRECDEDENCELHCWIRGGS
jgi:hypothetical protein